MDFNQIQRVNELAKTPLRLTIRETKESFEEVSIEQRVANETGNLMQLTETITEMMNESKTKISTGSSLVLNNLIAQSLLAEIT